MSIEYVECPQDIGGLARVPSNAMENRKVRAEVIGVLRRHAETRLAPGAYFEIRMKQFGDRMRDYGREFVADPDPDHRGVAWYWSSDLKERECPAGPVWEDWRGYWLVWTGRTPDA